MKVFKEIVARLQSPVAIPAVLALVYFILTSWAGYQIPGWGKFVDLFLGLLLAFGVVNNPAKKDGF